MPVARSNVIPFRRAEPTPELTDSLLCYVIACVRALGEPATVAEIENLLEVNGIPGAQIGLEDLMRSYSDQSLRAPMFRKVQLAGSEAWAFTPEFRGALRRDGLEIVLRGAV